LASKLARSVPVRTAAARGLYSAGERLGRGADWIDRSAPEAQNTLAQAEEAPSPTNATQGPEAWQSKGAQKLLEAGFTADEINRLRHTRTGQQILQDAGDVSPNSRAMAAIKQRVRNLR
jgi:hypothetical protein